MSIQIEIIPVEQFEIKINGKNLGKFDHVSSWEGMLKLKNKDGYIIADDNRHRIDKIFNGDFFKEKSDQLTIIKISPVLATFAGITVE